jgi:hypothetical protein
MNVRFFLIGRDVTYHREDFNLLIDRYFDVVPFFPIEIPEYRAFKRANRGEMTSGDALFLGEAFLSWP